MKKTFFAAAAFVCAAAAVACQEQGANNIAEGDPARMDSLSYCFGANIGYNLKAQMGDFGSEFNADLLKQGLGDGLLDKSKQKHEDAIAILQEYFTHSYRERMAKVDEQREAAKADSTVVIDYSVMFESKGECDSVSYAFGNDMGQNIRATRYPLHSCWIVKGFGDSFEGYSEIDQDKVISYLDTFFLNVYPEQCAEKSKAWLAEKEKGWRVKKTESGLLYKVLRSGDMKAAAVDDRDTVVVRYEGRNRDGEVFDSSYKRVEEVEKQIAEVKKDKSLDAEQRKERVERLKKQKVSVETVEFPLNHVIPGWTEGMKLVGKGGKIKLYVPSELAYGRRGAGSGIGPNEAIEFSVEVVDVKPYAEPQPVVTPDDDAEEDAGNLPAEAAVADDADGAADTAAAEAARGGDQGDQAEE